MRNPISKKIITKSIDELAEEGNEFFQNAVVEYNEASEERKQSMEEWLCSVIDDSTIADIGIRVRSHYRE